MAKVVYNACFGGFSLSRAAVLLGRELSGNPKWGGVCIAGDEYEHGRVLDHDYGHIEDVPRHDPILVQVVEKLNRAADGSCAALDVREIPAGASYRIDEYDGSESVHIREECESEWITP